MNQQQQVAGILLIVFGILAAFLVVWLIVYIFYLITLSRALAKVSPRNRQMEPGHVWLMFVPCLNIVWGFLIVIRVPDSLKAEFQDRGRDDGSDYGKGIGLTYCILNLAGSFLGNAVSQIPDQQMTGSLVSLAVLAVTFSLWIVFWVKIAGYSRLLDEDDEGRYREFGRRFGDDDDDDDDRDDGRDTPRIPSEGSDAIKEGEPGTYKP